jgi:hypothetical protein
MEHSQEIEMQVETLRQLFADGVGESRAYDQLSVDRDIVKSIYNEEREKIIQAYSVDTVKYEYSSITIDSKDAVQDCGFDDFEDFFDKICMLNEHFAVILHGIRKDEEFHNLTILDMFNNVVKFVFKKEN